MLGHTEIERALRMWATNGSRAKKVKMYNSHWNPDLALIDENKSLVTVYEIKPERTGYSDLRQGIVQSLEGFIYGCKSYLVINIAYVPDIEKILSLIPQIGLITYNHDGKFELSKEAEIPKECGIVASRFIDSDNIIRLGPRTAKRRYNRKRGKGGKILVQGCSYIRNGLVVRCPSHSRRRPDRRLAELAI